MKPKYKTITQTELCTQLGVPRSTFYDFMKRNNMQWGTTSLIEIIACFYAK